MSNFIDFIETTFSEKGLKITTELDDSSRKDSDSQDEFQTFDYTINVYSDSSHRNRSFGRISLSITGTSNEVAHQLRTDINTFRSNELDKYTALLSAATIIMNKNTSFLFREFFLEKQQEAFDKEQSHHDDLLKKGFIKITKEKAAKLLTSLITSAKDRSDVQGATSSYKFTFITNKGVLDDFVIKSLFTKTLILIKHSGVKMSQKAVIKDLTGSYIEIFQDMQLDKF